MDVFIPALIFSALSSSDFELVNYKDLAIGSLVVVIGSGLILWPLAKFLKVSAKTFLPPMMFNNSGNMGIPLLVLAFGEAALPAAIVLFIVEMLLHFSVGVDMLDPHTSIVKRLRLPIVFASISGLALSFSGVALLWWV